MDPEAPDEEGVAAEVDANDEEGRGCWNCFCLEGEAFGMEAVVPSDDEAKGLEAVVSPLTSRSSATDRKALRESWATFTYNNIKPFLTDIGIHNRSDSSEVIEFLTSP